MKENLDEIPCRNAGVLTPACLRLCLSRDSHFCAYTRCTWSKKGLRRPYATPVLHKMQMTPQRELTHCILCTMDIYYTQSSDMDAEEALEDEDEEDYSEAEATISTSTSSSCRPAANLQQQQQQQQQQEVEKWKWKGDARKPHCI